MIAPAIRPSHPSAAVADPATLDPTDWWTSLKHGGLLIAPAKLTEFFVPERLPPLPFGVGDRLQSDIQRLRNGDEAHLSKLLDTVLEEVLGLPAGEWLKGNALDAGWAQRSMTRETIKPRRVWLEANGGVLPVFVADGKEQQGRVARLGVGRGKRAVSRVLEWLRKADQKIALLTNGYQWRLIYAGADSEAWCEWDIDLWLEQGRLGPQVTALRLLLGEPSLRPAAPGQPSVLLGAIAASRQVQAQLSGDLGERVRKAVELLIRESAPALDDLLNALPDFAPKDIYKDIYIAASRIIMRCVVVLFAEARDLLPRDNAIYHSSYGIQGLREQLTRQAGGRAAERLRNGYGAWPRLLALFRLIYNGSAHERLPVPRYGGGLFAPGDAASADGVLRALAVLEQSSHPLSDAAVYRILELLCRSRVKVRQGKQSVWVEAPVDFSDLSSEYIGMLYEGLLDFELRRADDAMVFLNLGDQPVLPLARLEGMDDRALAVLVEKLRQAAKPSAEDAADDPAEDAADDAAEDATDETLEAGEAEEPGDADSSDSSDSSDLGPDDPAADLRQRALRWATRAAIAGGLVAKPRSKKPDAQADYERQVSKVAAQLIARVVLPGEWFLVRWGGTRKGSGTFYTRPQLATPTVWRTLQPLAYTPVPHTPNPPTRWQPKRPEQILALKVCDPAMGSGSFLVSALRFLTEALYESLHAHDCLSQHGDRTLCRLADGAATNSLLEETLPLPPDHPDFEERLKARLKRHIVERCLYGVDINPLAVELARLSLWVETMDAYLPFGFLDHKLKCGNSLVGCWFDQFQDYPVMAWERDAGDKTHKGVHFAKEGWTKEIKRLRNEVVRDELRQLLFDGVQLSVLENRLVESPAQTHDALVATVEQIHAAVLNPDQQAADFQSIRQSPAVQRLKGAFDCWCAVWFWQGSDLQHAPTPLQFANPSPEVSAAVERLAQEYQFFHWELEFPDVFCHAPAPGAGSGVGVPGFDAIVGNPPWEIQKPNSKEFFSNIDPLYRTYGKQEALDYQQRYFAADPKIEENWLTYCARLKALSNWCKYAAHAFGDDAAAGSTFSLSRQKKEAEQLAEQWRNQRQTRTGYSDPEHPFRYQGSADINTYKLFAELSHALLKDGGRFSLIIPSGIYTDKGTGTLRGLFLNRCEWTHLYAFQNERFVFGAIDHRNKMVVLSVNKGGHTQAVATRFRLGPGDSPEAQELETDILNDSRYLSVPADQINRFSPNTRAILELRTVQDLKILEKMYANGVLLGDDGPQGWGIRYATEFHMTNDSKLFPPRPKWEAQGYRPDEYGHWLKGNWQPYSGEASILKRPEGLVLSVDGEWAIALTEVEDIALPLYQGVMIHQFDFSRKGWISGTGLRAIWEDIDFENKYWKPQYLIRHQSWLDSSKYSGGLKIGYREVARSTDERSLIGSVLPSIPCGHKVPILELEANKTLDILSLAAVVNSFIFDGLLRNRLGATSISVFLLQEAPIPALHKFSEKIPVLVARLNLLHPRFAQDWLSLTEINSGACTRVWRSLWAITPYERLRLRCILDAVVAELYGLDLQDFAWILRDCDHPARQVCDSAFARTLEPKGFWRVDKEKDPELRHTVLSLVAFHQLQQIGLDAFLNLNDGEGWMLPDTLRLADYGLGHDDRAKEPQPVAARLGDRFLPWQLAGTPAESWEECERHAETLRRLLGDPRPAKGNDLQSPLQLSVLPDNWGKSAGEP
ncbi:Eco57I restriction-modification methylase domain-containing protein [Thermoleptolyngbya sp.]